MEFTFCGSKIFENSVFSLYLLFKNEHTCATVTIGTTLRVRVSNLVAIINLYLI